MEQRDEITLVVAENIRAIMNRSGVKASHLAESAGLNPTGVYDILSGKSKNPRLDTIAKIAAALGVPVSMLLDRPGDASLREEMALIFERLPPAERDRLILTARAWLQSQPD